MLRCLGLCGIDDSTNIAHLQLLSKQFPFVEWGVLFRPDKAGEPRYASDKWISKLVAENYNEKIDMHLAGHLCGERVNQVLRGDTAFVKSLIQKGFRRVQVNATFVNGVDKSNIDTWGLNLLKCMVATPELEWILQANDETKDSVIAPVLSCPSRPHNVSILYDSSCGTGVVPASFPEHIDLSVKCGYAGGIGPSNIATIMKKFQETTKDYPHPIWIDMESSLRAIVDGADVFSLDKSFLCMSQASKGNFIKYNEVSFHNDKSCYESKM